MASLASSNDTACFLNGTSWALSLLVAEQNTLGALLLVLVWSFTLIFGLWQFTRYILPNALLQNAHRIASA